VKVAGDSTRVPFEWASDGEPGAIMTADTGGGPGDGSGDGSGSGGNGGAGSGDSGWFGELAKGIGILALVVLGVQYVKSMNDDSGAGTSRGSSSAGSRGGGPYVGASAPVTPDPVVLAFRRIVTGSCVNAYYDGTGFSKRAPEPVACDRDDAYLRVVDKVEYGSECESSSEGRVTWGAPYSENPVTLCLEREFHRGECFPIEWVGSAGKTNAMLYILWPCTADTVPRGADNIVRITALYKWRAGGEFPCRRGEYWYSLEGREISICGELANGYR
jgi:eukaryotic-like serine/threonine-protein kinase